MPEIVIAIFGPIILIGWLIVYYRDWNYIWKTVDGVSSLDGIIYLIKDTDVNYVMYKLSSVGSSNMIKWHFFTKENDNEGLLKFGGMAYGLRSYLGEDMNMGLSYRVRCVQKDSDVIMKISYEGGRIRWSAKTAFTIANQAYHRFFKEQFNVQIIPETEV